MKHAVARRELDALEARQEAILARIERETDSRQRLFKPSQTTWSLAEVVEHLGLSTHGMLATVRPAVEARSRRRPFGTLRWWAVRTALRSPIRVKVPVPQIQPRSGVTWEEAVTRARSGMTAWRRYLADLEGTGTDVVFTHPIADQLTVEQTVRFLRDHFEHHVPQLKRLLNA